MGGNPSAEAAGGSSAPVVPCSQWLARLDMEAVPGCEWWETELASVILAVVTAGPRMGVFAAIVQVLREGRVPNMVDTTSAEATFGLGQEWVEFGIDPVGVVGWIRAGCWKPIVARAMTDAGLRPWQLLDQTGTPLHWIEIGMAPVEQIPLAQAVAEEFVPIAEAVRIVLRHAHTQATTRIVERFADGSLRRSR